MEQFKVQIYFDASGWYVEQTGDNRIFVFPTKRSAMRKAEAILDAAYPKETVNEK